MDFEGKKQGAAQRSSWQNIFMTNADRHFTGNAPLLSREVDAP